MAKKWILMLSALLVSLAGTAQKVSVYTQLPSDRIHASASGHHERFPASLASDGSGMTFGYHQSSNQGEGMWLSNVSESPTRANPNTRQGAAWIMFKFDNLEKNVDFIQIWNHNQNQHTRRGLQKVYIEYSADGTKWATLKNGDLDYFIIPEALGRKQEPASLSINTGGIDLIYICITADAERGNYYHDGNPATMQQTRELRQNPDYYALSEVRFFRRSGIPVSELQQIPDFKITPSQGYMKTAEGPSREFTMEFPAPLYAGGKLTVSIPEGKTRTINIAPSPEGITRIDGTFPAGYMKEAVKAEVVFTSRQGNATKNTDVPAARKWTLYFLPHSHQDIGYTHRQNDVMTLQWRNLEKAMELAERTREYPTGARYKWNAEATWSVQGYLDEYESTPRAAKLLEAIKRGDIGMDATLGSILTGISKQEELMHYFDDAHKIAALTGTEINTAMMSDVPGQSWGLVNAMAQNGVRYFSSGPNYVPTLGRLGSYGVGLYNLLLGDVPFWWQSQSGNERVLYWQTGKGYSMFHGWLMDKLSVCGTAPVWGYLAELEDKEYPYPLTYLRYTIHGDNGPPDEQMPDVIREWNEKYEYPKFIIGTTKELFTEMERLYGYYLPVYEGDMTPIWEDGAASTARELAMNRQSAEKLNQAEILWSILRPAQFPAQQLNQAWKYVVLFSEHTWGAAGSGPEPESEFTKDLWAAKKSYADSAAMLAGHIYGKALENLGTGQGEYINVINTNLWTRSDIVAVEGANLTGKHLLSPSGEHIPVQKLSDGRWIFYAKETPALSASGYRILPGQIKRETPLAPLAADNALDNGRIRVEIDAKTGAISSLRKAGDNYEYAGKEGLNGYIYSGRRIEDTSWLGSVKSVTVLEEGDVAATIRVVSDAPGCKSLVRDVTVYRDIDRVDIANTVDKQNVYQHENVRFAFPFNFFNPEVTVDLAMSEMHPEREQIVSSNKNFYSILNGVSVANIQRGIYLSSIDAPFIEMGTPTADVARQAPAATGWLNAATVSPVIYSWAMNNRWRTNYKASQEGLAVFRYSVQTFDPQHHDLKKYGSEQAQQMIAVVSKDGSPAAQMFRLKGNNRIALSTMRPAADGSGYIVRLQNMSPQSVNTSFEWGTLKGGKAYLCDNTEKITGELDTASFWMKPFDCITIKITAQK